jgi:Histidine kinase-, DNA gyrase B-, and HSP90-like ATPase
LKTADHYQKLLANPKQRPKVRVDLTIDADKILVHDTAPGISSDAAESHVFKFGRAEAGENKRDRLSVYGLGLKRAMFKCGNKIDILSDHQDGGFNLSLDVRKWEAERGERWTFNITKRNPEKKETGTRITITQLHEDVSRRISDGVFIGQLREIIARTYTFFIDRIVDINVNDVRVESESFEIGGNYASQKLVSNGVSCTVTAGMASSKGEVFREKNSGWYIFCNGRTVLFADKSSLTGWGAGLPIFQPKHRPFLGTVFFVSEDPEDLPWTTTKGSINQEKAIWQEARREMITVGRVVTGFLDRRYTDDGTEVNPSELQTLSGPPVKMLTAAVAQQRAFRPPSAKASKITKIQFDADPGDVKRIAAHLRRPGMSGSEVGRYTFNHYLKNEVGGDQ